MAQDLSETLLLQLSGFVAAQMGLYFPRQRWNDLERGIRSAAAESQSQDVESFCRGLLESNLARKQVEALASHLTVGETYFFRQKQVFELLETEILPPLISSREKTDRRLRFWSAGCATGEEAYSLAMLLDKMISNRKDWKLTILATDINPLFLKKADAGVYTEWSFRDSPSRIKERYFKKNGEGQYKVSRDLHSMVTFGYLNLVDDCFPSLSNNTNAIDILFCRNVLMYMSPAQARKILEGLHASLMEGGILVVSPSETASLLSNLFVPLNFPDVTLYKKDSLRDPTVKAIRESGAMVPSWPQEVFDLTPPVMNDHSTFFPGGVTRGESRTIADIGETGGLSAELPPSLTTRKSSVASARQAVGAAEESADVLTEAPENSKSMIEMARALANQGALAEARAWCEKAIAADKMKAGLHYLRSTILQEEDNFEEAAAELTRTLYLDPDFVLAHFALGLLALRRGKPEHGARHFKNAVSILARYPKDTVLSDSEGITAGRLQEIIESTSAWRSLGEGNSKPPRWRARQ